MSTRNIAAGVVIAVSVVFIGSIFWGYWPAFMVGLPLFIKGLEMIETKKERGATLSNRK